MNISQDRIDALRALLVRPSQQIVILSHTNPDGDAIGSSLAWSDVLTSMGHRVTCIVPNKYPYFLDWMPGIADVVTAPTPRGAPPAPSPGPTSSSASTSTPSRGSRT